MASTNGTTPNILKVGHVVARPMLKDGHLLSVSLMRPLSLLLLVPGTPPPDSMIEKRMEIKGAFEKLFPHRGYPSIVFNSNLSKLKENAKCFALKCGILNEKKSKSLSCRTSHLSFTHKTMQ